MMFCENANGVMSSLYIYDSNPKKGTGPPLRCDVESFIKEHFNFPLVLRLGIQCLQYDDAEAANYTHLASRRNRARRVTSCISGILALVMFRLVGSGIDSRANV